MAYFFKSIAATQFLLNMLFIYFFVKCNIFKFHNCCSVYKWVMATLLLLLLKMWKITNISKTRDRAISSKFLTHRLAQEYLMQGGKNFNFRHFWQPSSILAENEKCEFLEKCKR